MKVLYEQIFVVVLTVAIVVPNVSCYPFHVSDQECRRMVPGSISAEPQKSPAPFIITVNQNMYGDRMKIEVTVKKTGTLFFRGLHLQARVVECPLPNSQRQPDEEPIGTFESIDGSNDLKIVNCSGKTHSGVFNSNWIPRDEVQVYWTAPVLEKRKVKFHAVVMVDRSTYWAPVSSETLRHYMDFVEDNGISCSTIGFKVKVDPQPQVEEETDNGTGCLRSTFGLNIIFMLALLHFVLK